MIVSSWRHIDEKKKSWYNLRRVPTAWIRQNRAQKIAEKSMTEMCRKRTIPTAQYSTAHHNKAQHSTAHHNTHHCCYALMSRIMIISHVFPDGIR